MASEFWGYVGCCKERHFTIHSNDGWDVFFADDFYHYLRTCGHIVDYEKCARNCKEFALPDIVVNKKAISHSIIVEDSGGEFIIIDHKDYDQIIFPEIVHHPNCVAVFKAQYLEGNYDAFLGKVFPYTYRVCDSHAYDRLRLRLCSLPRSRDITKMALKCRGVYDRKNIIQSFLAYVPEVWWSNNKENISLEEFLLQMKSCGLTLSLPGNGNFCHRELESFGIGVPVIMPELKNRYYDPLIPDYHYVSCGAYENNEEMGVLIRDRFLAVKDDQDFLDFVADNALKWYMRNIRFPENVRLAFSILKEHLHV